jgi:hypothetical protein
MKKIYMILKTSALTLFALFTFQTATFAQEEAAADTTVQEQPKDKPVRPAFESAILFDASTTTLYPSKTLEFVLQHRFGVIDTKDNNYDMAGIWGSANIRFGLNYSILDNLMVGVGTTKFNKMEDIQVRYRILEQTRSNSIPVTVVFNEVVGIDGSPDSKWDGTPSSVSTKAYKFSNRMSYYSELIVSRRFNDQLSLQVGGAFTHYNCIDSVYNHDRFSVSFAGRYKFSPQLALIVAGEFPLDINNIKDFKKDPSTSTVIYDKPNLTAGIEIATSSHAFHIYAGSAQGILPQECVMWNKNDFFHGGILIGLNITRLWNF